MSRRRAATIAAMSLVPLGCGSETSTGAVDGEPTGSVLVVAASSLTDAAPELVEAFERANPVLDVEVSLGGSSSLALGVQEGSPADVFISANTELIDRLDADGLVAGVPVTIASNDVVLAAGSASPMTSIDDFADPDHTVGACAEQVPCGTYADRLFESAAIDPSFDTREPNVRAVVAKIRDGELDGGVVYRSDVEAFPDDLREIVAPSGVAVSASVTAAVVVDSTNPAGATAFVEFLTGDAARAILTERGFDAP